MTPTVTQITLSAITSNSYETLSTTLGMVVIPLLLVLLIQREFIRALGGDRSGMWLKALDTAIVPLLLMFGFVMVMRLLVFLPSE